MSNASDFVLDEDRTCRIGFGEAVFCAGKSVEQIAAIIEAAAQPMLLTRLALERFEVLPREARAKLDYEASSQTAFLGEPTPAVAHARVAIVTAGTSDVPAAREAARTLRFNGYQSVMIADVGVAGLWRLMKRVEELRAMPVLIVAAGMDAALPSVLGGLVPGMIVAIPTSVGYGVAAGGHTALNAILASCAPGVATVNIDNGYGAACVAMRVLNLFRISHPQE